MLIAVGGVMTKGKKERKKNTNETNVVDPRNISLMNECAQFDCMPFLIRRYVLLCCSISSCHIHIST